MMNMRATILFFMAVLAVGYVAAAEGYDLNGGWRFTPAGGTERQVNLPHTWSTDGNQGVVSGVYVRELNVPAEWGGRRIFLRFEGAGDVLTLIVNGRLAGEHRGGYTSSTFEITGLVDFGKANTLRAMVSNSPRNDVLPTAGWGVNWGGLTRGVRLFTTARTAIALTDHSSEEVYVRSRREREDEWRVAATVGISSADDCTVQALVRLIDRAGDEVARADERVRVAAGRTASVEVPLTVQTPHLWDGVENPYMYRVRVTLSVDGAACDSTSVSAGLRDYGYDPSRGFILNGRPYPLRGVTLTHDRLGSGSALTREQIERDVRLVRELGANFVWVTSGAHSGEFYDICDREGLMAVAGVPFLGEAYPGQRPFFNTPAFMDNGREQLTDMIRQYFNHPSIIMWSIFENVYRRGDDPLPYIRELAALAKREDPARPTVCRSDHDGEQNFAAEMILWQHRFGWSSGAAEDMVVWLDHLHRSWGRLVSGVSYGAGGDPREHADSLSRPSTAIGARHPERWQTHVHSRTWDIVKGDSLLWCVLLDNMFDSPVPDGGMNDMGLVSFDRSLRKDAFWFYKAKWNASDHFVRIADSRREFRRGETQAFTVFSNLPRVELFVEGRSLGVKEGAQGVFTWPDVKLPQGESLIEARSGDLSHSARITVVPFLP